MPNIITKMIYPYWFKTSLILISVGLTVSLLLVTTGALPWHLVYTSALERFSGDSFAWNALLDERIPRLLVLLCTGASLAAAGTVMQALLQNPLAAPSVLGLTSGSSLAVIITLIMGWSAIFPWAVPIAAIMGTFTVLFFIATLWKRQSHRPLGDLLLTGIAISTLLLAIQSALLYAYRDQWQLIQTVTEWEAGSSYNRNWQHVHMQAPLAITGLAICWHYRPEINLLALGEEEALSLGVDVNTVRWRLILSVSLLIGGATAALGSVPFFGLLLPHIIRQIYGANHRYLLPLCIGWGAVVLTSFDVALRLTNIHFLTIGNLSALCGAILFVAMLRRRHAQFTFS